MELWRPIPGCDSYEVSDHGWVRSPRGLLACNPGSGGYRVAYMKIGRRTVARKVSGLVLEAFCGPRPEGMYACHNNGNKTDDRLCNLRWGTPSSNNFDTVRHGRHWASSRDVCKHGHSLIDEANVIREPSRIRTRICRACRLRNQKKAEAKSSQTGFASGEHDYEPGDTLSLKAATVKAHEVYEGIDQTVITRGILA